MRNVHVHTTGSAADWAAPFAFRFGRLLCWRVGLNRPGRRPRGLQVGREIGLDIPALPGRHFIQQSGGSTLPDASTRSADWKLASELTSVAIVERSAEQFALEGGFDEDTAGQIAMVTREAVVNAILHGNRYDPAKHVAAAIELNPDNLTITISDEGEGIHPESIPDPLAPENILRSSGRGVFLMRAFMDEVDFRQLHPGTQVRLVKHRGNKEMTA